LESPITPSTRGAIEAGIFTVAELEKYLMPRGSRYVLSVVLNAADTRWLDPTARTRNGEDDRWIFSPLALRYAITAFLVAGVGENRWSNTPLAIQWWYMPLCLVYRAFMARFRPAGFLDASDTSIDIRELV
jgi:hypothetical protein